jgi:hypothetical protein
MSAGVMKRAARDLALAISLLALSAYVWYETASYPAPAGEAGAEGLGPAFYPRLLAITLAGLACLVAAAMLRGRPTAAPVTSSAIPASGRLHAAILLGILLAYWLLMPLLGYLLCTFAALAAAMLLLVPPARRRRPGTLALIGSCSAAATLGVFMLFTRVVKVPIPMGRLFGG